MEKSSVQKNGQACMPCGFRYIVVILTFLGYIYAYVTRVCLSVALVAMVNNTDASNTKSDSNDSICEEPHFRYSQNQSTISSIPLTGPQFSETFDWDLKTQSYLLSALFYGCMASQLVGGIMTQHCGIRWVFGITGLVSSALFLVTPIAASWNVVAVIVIRVVQGILQGPLYPVRSQVVSFWMPVLQRSRAFSFVCVGNQVGIVTGMFLSGILADSQVLGWPSIFYVFGTAGALWSVSWLLFVSDSPQEHRCVSQKEIKIIQEGRLHQQPKVQEVPWKDILKSLPVWAYTVAMVGHNVGLSIFITQLPAYINKVLRFDLTSSAALSAAPAILQALVALVGSYVSDTVRRSEKFSMSTIRKTMTAIGFIVPGLCLLGIAFAGCRSYLIVVLLCVGFGITGLLYPGCLIVPVDMCPTFTAVPTGIANSFGTLAAAVVPYVVAVLTSSGQTAENWSTVFLVVSAALIIAGLQFVLFGSAERQPWDVVKLANGEGPPNPAMEAKKKDEITKF